MKRVSLWKNDHPKFTTTQETESRAKDVEAADQD